MFNPLRLKQGLIAVSLIVAFVLQETTSVLAGTTGTITGTVTDASTNQPISAARVTAASPSQTASTTTDRSGRFTFVSLSPDTYTLSIGATEGRDAAVVNGVTVLADQSLTVTLLQAQRLKTIGSVTSRASSALVKPGTTADVYSINATTQDKDSSFSGGGTMNSAWSAITAVPGVYVAPNRAGYVGAGPSVSIRGGDYNQIGYELDGIPVNRSFDNYPSSQLSSLGQQELQVYTGATPANAEANGISGYINQVIKSGSAPAYRTIDLGIGSPTFYNKLSFETGGANPARTFSYYVGLGGYNQDYRYADQFNGASLSNLYGVPITTCANAAKSLGANYTSAVVPSCFAPNGQSYTNGTAGTRSYVLGPYSLDSLATVEDRDNIVNLHFGIPHKDGNKDDVQLLWDYSHFSSIGANSTNDQGGAAFLRSIGAPVPTWTDGYSFVGAPLGSTLPQTYAGGGTTPYLYPLSPTGRTMGSAIAPNYRDGTSNDQSIIKLQYQKNFGTNAYLRIYGYTNYSDWLENGPVSTTQAYSAVTSSDYAVDNHSRGLSVQFSDQLNQQHLLTVEGSYTSATSLRNNSTEMLDGSSSAVTARTVVGVMVDSSNPYNGICYNPAHQPTPCFASTGALNGTLNYYNSKTNPNGFQYFTFNQAANGGVTPASGTCGAGACEYLVSNNGLYSTYNGVTPKFSSASITDNWTPSAKLTLNLGLRFDRFEFDGMDTSDTGARVFWYNAYNLNFGTNIQNVPSQIEAYSVVQPRVGMTYTLNPTTVLRASYGRYAEAPNAAFEQYNYLQPNDLSSLAIFGAYGLPTTPGHPVSPQISNNYDFSLEKQLGRDVSFKLSPFYRKTQDQIQQFYLDQKTSFVSGLNVGQQTSEGVELELQKGDFARNGFAGTLSFTYTNSYINYGMLPNGTTIVDPINNAINLYNSYTKGGGGSPCYAPGTSAAPGAGEACTATGAIANPYYNAPTQSLISPNTNFPTFDTLPGGVGGGGYSQYGAPYVATLLLQYKHDKLAITPALQFSAGARYGVPESTPGVVPGTCAALPGTTTNDPRYPYGAPGGAPYNATTCATGTSTQPIFAIPDQYTGMFDGIGAFVRPASLQLHLQTTYDLTRKISLVANFSNLINTCFGGTKVPWSVAGACSYGGPIAGLTPYGNAYNPGMSLQPFLATPYDPGFAGFPFNMYLEARIKL